METVEPIGLRVLVCRDENKKETKSGIILPDKIEIPTLTGRIVAISAKVELDPNYPIEELDKILFNPKRSIPVDLETDNKLYVIPVDDVVAIFRRQSSNSQ